MTPVTQRERAHLSLALMLERELDPLGLFNAPLLTPTPGHRDGILLLLGSLGLAMLVVASSTLLRLIARLRSEWWEGRAR